MPRIGLALLALLALLGLALATRRLAGERNLPPKESSVAPILVELFTSEGCSSCPPADAFLQKMDVSQPVPGARVIVLSEHVNYWDHDGWKDPYSSSLLTERQTAYVRALKLSDLYTPQIIVDGITELHANNPQQVSQIFEKATATPKVPVRIGSLNMEAKSPPVLHGRVE